MGDSKPTIVVYIASTESGKEFKQLMRGRDEISVATKPGIENQRDDYFKQLGQMLRKSASGIDLIIFDNKSISENVRPDILLRAVISYAKGGLTTHMSIVIVDTEYGINQGGRDALAKMGIRVIDDLGDLGPLYRPDNDPRNAQDDADGYMYDSTGHKIPKPVEEKVEEKHETPIGQRLGLVDNSSFAINKESIADPFSDIKTSSDVSGPFTMFGDVDDEQEPDDDSKDELAEFDADPLIGFDTDPLADFDGDDGAEARTDPDDPLNGFGNENGSDYDDNDDDPFDDIDTDYYDDDSRHNDPFADMSGDDDYDDDDDNNSDGGLDRYKGNGNTGIEKHSGRNPYGLSDEQVESLTGGYSGTVTEHDIERLIEMGGEPKWDYSQMNEGRNSGIFKSRNNQIGEVDETSLMSSAYIDDFVRRTGTPYSAPSKCKIIDAFSPSGGVGKTTIASIIATQLNWYFNRDLMMGRTSSHACRVLVLSLNEFDDLSNHNIGYQSVIGNDNDGRNIAELTKRIDECGRIEDIRWDDISHCFACIPENSVFYVPAMSLTEKFSTRVEITKDDYAKVLAVCTRFFQFIILDTPDLIYDQKEGIVEWAFENADLNVFVIEPDRKNTMHLLNLFNGWKSINNGRLPIPASKMLMVVNKYIAKGNPYVTYTPRKPQIPLEQIKQTMYKDFSQIIAMPMTEYRAQGSILFGTDPTVKQAAADIADACLEMIDANDAAQSRRHHT